MQFLFAMFYSFPHSGAQKFYKHCPTKNLDPLLRGLIPRGKPKGT